MAFGDNMIYVDPQRVVSKGQKRHVYRDGGPTAYRRCGSTVGGKTSKSFTDLGRMEAQEFAVLPNACIGCVKALDLMAYREANKRSGGGADSVDYDPFGVFGGGDA